VLALYFLVLLVLFDRFWEPSGLTTGSGIVSRATAFLLGFAVGGGLLHALKPLVRSLYSSMLLAMLCLVPVLTGAGVLMAGWRWIALAMLVLTVPLGAALGFIDWNNLYKHARPKRIPPSA
jgi:hypothetical protein